MKECRESLPKMEAVLKFANSNVLSSIEGANWLFKMGHKIVNVHQFG